jgi:hypothetical protein
LPPLSALVLEPVAEAKPEKKVVGKATRKKAAAKAAPKRKAASS